MAVSLTNTLGEIVINKKTYKNWLRHREKTLDHILKNLKKGEELTTKDISKEEFFIHNDGSAEIVVSINKVNGRISLRIPKGKWFLKKPNQEEK